jgi:hypothetical protein
MSFHRLPNNVRGNPQLDPHQLSFNHLPNSCVRVNPQLSPHRSSKLPQIISRAVHAIVTRTKKKMLKAVGRTARKKRVTRIKKKMLKLVVNANVQAVNV